jgi:hypothetical protein
LFISNALPTLGISFWHKIREQPSQNLRRSSYIFVLSLALELKTPILPKQLTNYFWALRTTIRKTNSKYINDKDSSKKAPANKKAAATLKKN